VTTPLAALREVSKHFGALRAVDALSLDVYASEVHAVVGGNGAGKTTAMKVLAGLEQPDAGQVVVGGRPVRFRSRRDAIRAGIGFIQQEFSLVDRLTCAENLLLGHPEEGFVLDRRRAVRRLRELTERFGVSLDPERLVGALSMGERQQLEILIALSWGVRVLILDEPTSSTGESGLDFLRTAFGMLREAGIGVIYISHKLPEVLELADRVTVIRRGRKVFESTAGEADPGRLAREMVGDTSLLTSRRRRRQAGDLVLRLSGVDLHWSEDGRSLEDVSLAVRAHEVLGIAGVVGNGQRELARVCAGVIPPDAGEIMLPRRIGYVVEDRPRDGLALDLPPSDNAIVHAHRRPPIARGGLLSPGAARAFTLRVLERFHADPSAVSRTRTRELSGGNQQRLVLGRELEEARELLVLHNPSRGLDVAATAALFRQLDEFCEGGGAALLISPDLDELLEWADAIQVLVDGQLSQRLPADRDAAAQIAERMAGVV
jgi:general nucleoside transport system ATP-binding protein